MSRFEPSRYEYIFKNNESKNGTFYFRGTVSGKFIEKSLKTNLISKAKDRADLIRKEPEEFESQVRRTFEELFELTLKLKGIKSHKSLDEAKCQITHLGPWFKKHCPFIDTFEKNYEEIWTDYIIHQQVVAPHRKLHHDRKVLIFALRRANNKKWIRTLFEAKLLPLAQVEESVGKNIEDADVSRLLTYLEPHPKIYLQILIALTMGMRKSEILHLQKDEIDLKNREINLDPSRLKIRRPRKVPIPISDLVYPLLKEAHDKALGIYIFPAQQGGEYATLNLSSPQDNNRYWWYRAQSELGLDVRFHDLRHTAITNALAAGLPSITASKIFGASIKTISRIYDHLKHDTKDQFRRIFNDKYGHKH